MTRTVKQLARQKRQSLEKSLAKLDQFIAECPAAIAAVQEDRARAEEEREALTARWKAVGNWESGYQRKLHEASALVWNLWDEAQRRLDKRSLLACLVLGFRQLPPVELKASFRLNDWFNCGIPGAKRLDEWSADLVKHFCDGNYALFERGEITTVAETVRNVFQSARKEVCHVFRELVSQVESSDVLGQGSRLVSWVKWKETMIVWAESPSGELSDEHAEEVFTKFNIRMTCRLCDTFPELAEQNTRLHGRHLNETALDDAIEERQLIQQALLDYDKEAAELRRKHGFTDEIIAAAAAYLKRTQNLAAELRDEMLRELGDQTACPYCNGSLGDVPHLDHIHPSSQGGLSKRDNLVFVCANCNAYKRDLTLLSFAEDRAFNFLSIVARLREMGKRV